MSNTAVSNTAVRITALDLAEKLHFRFPPTQQQCAVIQAPLTPALVVAGAGSGKTETMANRVLWLLANGLVDVSEVLGLTFTRKAAGELGERVAKRIDQLREAGLLPESTSRPNSTNDAADTAGFQQPTVSTYNAFANQIFRDNALLVGREPESVLLNEASAWRLARRIVIEHGDERLVHVGKSVESVTDAVLELSRELSENEVDGAEVRRLVTDFAYLAELPYTDGKAKKDPYASVTKALSDVAPLPVLIELADRYAAQKRRLGLVEYSDQVALALAVCRRVPAVARDYRNRYRVVLLDEYQDTSVVQTRLLGTLFADHGVMAVGDPHQSIYGWRGASEANLNGFFEDFGATGSNNRFALSTSWRNSHVVLRAANTLVAPLRLSSRTVVSQLDPRPDAPKGRIDTTFVETISEEANCVAQWLASELAVDQAPSKSAAILFRARAHMGLFAQALEDNGIEHHILGLGGLLGSPEIVDIISALRVIHDPYAGESLIRLLAGARWRLGVRDLQALSDVAGWLHSRDWKQASLSDEVKQRMRETVSADDGRSIIDALDFVSEAPAGHTQLAGFSETGLERLRDAGKTLLAFRSRSGLGLLDLVRLIEQELLLDIEVVANETSNIGPANLHAFHDEISGFLAADEQGTVGSFLAWLTRAERVDNMGPRSENPEPGTVQLLTIHGAKGLEWDIVAVPRLVGEELPGKPKEGGGWLRFGKLPFEFRGDGNELPSLAWRGLPAQNHFDSRLKQFKTELADRHQSEERRLAYVAVTRARESLLLTGSFWSKPAKPRAASVFLTELADAGLVPQMQSESVHQENPLSGNELSTSWPLDPLGARREIVENAAARVLEAEAVAAHDERIEHSAPDDIDLLLAERDARERAMQLVELPTRIPASRFKDFIARPAEVAASLRRPMPERPYRQTRLGTLFHSWVEDRASVTTTSDLIYASVAELDDGPDTGFDQVELDRLKRVFETSEWASRRPEYIEEEIHLPLGDQVIICKIDAVYRQPNGADTRPRYQVVDWKTGKAPKDEADLELKQLQLALYRLAFARRHQVDLEQIDAIFYYVSDDVTITPTRLYSESELITAWSSVTGSSPA